MSDSIYIFLSFFAVLGLLVSLAIHAVKRLKYHCLSIYPGPPLAAMTSWYRVYYDVIKDGYWSNHLESLHKRYGKPFRITNTILFIPSFITQVPSSALAQMRYARHAPLRIPGAYHPPSSTSVTRMLIMISMAWEQDS